MADNLPVDPMTEFQIKLKMRVREGIADILPDAAIDELVRKAVDEEFFKPTILESGQYGRDDVLGPSWFVQEVRKAAQPEIDRCIQRFFDNHPGTVEKAIEAFLDENKLAVMVAARLTRSLENGILELVNRMRAGT